MPLCSGRCLDRGHVLASMAGFLDATVVSLAVPAIARDLGTSLVALQWGRSSIRRATYMWG
jgi:hypothetical protein